MVLYRARARTHKCTQSVKVAHLSKHDAFVIGSLVKSKVLIINNVYVVI